MFAGLLERRGRTNPRKLRETYGSTDLANVSRLRPTIEIMIKAGEHPIHTEGFARDAVSESGERALLDGVFCLTAAGYRLLTEPLLLQRVRKAFEEVGEE